MEHNPFKVAEASTQLEYLSSSPSLSTHHRLPWQRKLHHHTPLWLPTELRVKIRSLINISGPLFKRICNRISNSVKLPGMLWNDEVIGNQWRGGNQRLCICYPPGIIQDRSRESSDAAVFSASHQKVLTEYVVGCRLDGRLWSHINHMVFAIKKALHRSRWKECITGPLKSLMPHIWDRSFHYSLFFFLSPWLLRS